MYIDHSLYPDLDHPPDTLDSAHAKADYLHRVCTAWDFGIQPEPPTIELLRQWRDIFDRFPVAASIAYHALRSWYGWPAIPWPQGIQPPTPQWLHLDRLEGRPDDPCQKLI